MREAKYWIKTKSGVKCLLCPRGCNISNNHLGFCGVRKVENDILYSLTYGYPITHRVDPIEKKPFVQFMQGTKTFSIGTFGCNLNCKFCFNHGLSRQQYSSEKYQYFSPNEIVELAMQQNCQSIAFTYNEPTVFIEYAIDIAKIAKEKSIPVVLVSNGYISEESAKDFYPLLSAINIDMKGFSKIFYKDLTDSKFEKILKSIKYIYSIKKHLELITLVIPNENDSDEMTNKYLDWLEKNLDKDVVLHFNAYIPAYKYYDNPTTPKELLFHIKDIAIKRGFKNVFVGNI